MKRLVLLAFALVLVKLANTRATEAPLLQPSRDVDVTYRVPVPGADNASLLQRLRWSAARHQQRVDLPTSGTWMVLDFTTHRMELVRDATREIVDLPSPQTADQPRAGAGFSSQGRAVVAGLACTQWRTVDTRGDETLACYTNDGVLLRATSGTRLIMEAISVTYGSQQAALFTPPSSYSRLHSSR